VTANALQDLILSLLVKRVGGTRRRWRMALGPIRVRNQETHPHCNWSVSPSGSSGENEAIENLLDELRLQHPIIAAV